MTLITAWTLSGVKVVVLGADDENLSTIILSLGLSSVLESSGRNIIHATVKASRFFVLFVSIFFLKVA